MPGVWCSALTHPWADLLSYLSPPPFQLSSTRIPIPIRHNINTSTSPSARRELEPDGGGPGQLCVWMTLRQSGLLKERRPSHKVLTHGYIPS